MEHKDNFYETLGEDLVLPDNKKLRKQLELKLEEYRRRASEHRLAANKEGRNIVYTAPEVVSGTLRDLDFKAKVLGKLLKDSRISISDFEQDAVSDDDRTYLRNAFGVIKSYVEAGGEHVVGGTGLPEVEE